MGAAVASVARGMAAASGSLGDSNKCKGLHSPARRRRRQLRSVGSLALRGRERTEKAAVPLLAAPADSALQGPGMGGWRENSPKEMHPCSGEEGVSKAGSPLVSRLWHEGSRWGWGPPESRPSSWYQRYPFFSVEIFASVFKGICSYLIRRRQLAFRRILLLGIYLPFEYLGCG